jgi:hypothetical protein
LRFGLPMGDDFAVSMAGARSDQVRASVAAVNGDDGFFAVWQDSGNGLRARFVYPVYERHNGTLGATCGRGRTECDNEANLTCAVVSRTASFCHLKCNAPGQVCPTGGVCAAEERACMYPTPP